MYKGMYMLTKLIPFGSDRDKTQKLVFPIHNYGNNHTIEFPE